MELGREVRTVIANRMPKEVIRAFARPYVAGQGVSAAVRMVEKLWYERHILSTMDVLGEAVDTVEKANHTVEFYISLVDEFRELTLPQEARPTFSTKLSAFTPSRVSEDEILDYDKVTLENNIERLIQYAEVRGFSGGFDAEQRWWTEPTLELYHRKQRQHTSLGAALQACLKRTDGDVGEFHEGERVRLCKGIYVEPKDFSFRDSDVIFERMIRHGQYLAARGVYVEFATHHDNTILRFLQEVVIPLGLMPGDYELQNLMGVNKSYQNELVSGDYFKDEVRFPRNRLPEKARRSLEAHIEFGARLRFYVPIFEKEGDDVKYDRRRIIESPQFWGYGFKALPRVLMGR